MRCWPQQDSNGCLSMLDRRSAGPLATALACLPGAAHASFLSGEALDKAADVIALVVLFVVPVALIAVFWLVHILPEKVAEQREHPQKDAIKVLCLLSLVFGGMLWPLAWLWAYSRPVLYQMAYGTDKVVHGKKDAAPAPGTEDTDELRQLRQRIAELEARLLDGTSAADTGKV